jgi:hypothetical protein
MWVDVGVTPVSAQDTEQHGAHDVVGTAAAVADIVERTIAQELLPPSAGMEELEKENQLPFAGNRCLIIPLAIKTSAGSVQRP